MYRTVSEPDHDTVLAELERILADARFTGSPSLIRFLRHAVGETLAGRTRDLREGPLGLSVFDRGAEFDPRLDPIVRVQARKLRARLQDYYEHEGAADPVRIELPRGSYVPRFSTATVAPGIAPPVPVPQAEVDRKQWSIVRWGAIGTAAILTGILAWSLMRGRTSPVPALELNRLTFETGSTMWPVLSKDGKLLAYSSDRGKGDLNIWVQPVQGGTPLQLTHQESPALSPDFSPDGLRIVFRTRHSGGAIATVSVFGGEERRIADTGWLPRYSPDGAWIAYQGDGALYVVPSEGGQAREVASGNIELSGGPLWTPEGKHLIAVGRPRPADPSSPPTDWYAVPWTGGQPVALGLRKQLNAQQVAAFDGDVRPSDWLGDGIVFSMRRGTALNIWRAPVNRRTLRIAGPVIPLTSGSSFESPRSSASGQVVFYSEVSMTHIYGLRVDKLGRAVGVPEQLTEDSSLTPHGPLPRVSADGTKFAYVSSRSGAQEIMIRTFADGKQDVALAPLRQDLPLVAADSALMVYRTADAKRQLFYFPSSGQLLSGSAGEQCGVVHDWSPDGRRVLFETVAHDALILWDRDSSKRIECLKYRAGNLRHASLSRDGRWVALVLLEPAEGFVAPIEAAPIPPSRLIRVAAAPALASLHWSPDGNALYYVSSSDDHNCLWAQRLNAATRKPSGPPFAVYHFHNNRFSPWDDWISVAPDRLLFPATELRSDIWMTSAAAPKSSLR